MANINIDKIQMKRGNRATIPVLDDGEPAICLDTKEFAIGTPDGNLYFSFQDFADIVSEVGSAKGGYASLQEKLNSLVSSGGGSGALVYQTIADLQAAYPNGTTQPAWVVADNAWYYWSGAITDTTAPTVTMSPAAGLYNTSKSVTLTANETATIYYTTDGSTPTTSSSVYSAPISISATTTLKYFAKDTAGNSSAVQTAVFTIDTVAPTLTITAGGTFTGTKSVTMSANETATIYYTLDGSTPTTSSIVYSSALSITATTTLKAFAKDTAGNSSVVQTVTYTLGASDTTAPIVTASPAAGTYTAAQNVTLSANETATIYYTLDGTTPTTSSTVYSGPISIASTKTLQFIAKDTAGNTSAPVAATYTINIPADTTAPVLTITPAATFASTQTVTMSINETGTIWYTVDGTNPTTSGTKLQYSTPVTLSATTTVNAYAVDSASNASAVQTVTYTLDTSSPTRLVYDTFTRANSSNLGVTEEGNKTWVEPIEGFSIENNKVRSTSSGSLRRAVIDVAPTGIEIRISFTFGTYAGLVFRHTNETNFFFFKTGLGNTMLGAYKNATSATVIQQTSYVPANGQNCVMKVKIVGDNMKCYIDDVLYAETTDSTYNTVSGLGIIAHNDSTTLFDNFEVWSAS